jgi:glycosyltransferase involved in cell wall biosynthesis
VVCQLQETTSPGDGRLPKGTAGIWIRAGPGSAWKRYINSFLWVPDARQGIYLAGPEGSTRPCPRREPNCIPRRHPFPPISPDSFFARTRKVEWIAEFRDPWTDNPWKPKQLRSRPADALNSWLEKRCINAADRVITVTDSVGEILAAKLAPVRKSRVAVVRNGIDQLSPVGARTIGKPLRILHVGSVYHKRDPRPFFQALARIRTRSGLTSRDVAVSFVGNGRVVYTGIRSRITSEAWTWPKS